jgi:hypothetical protein
MKILKFILSKVIINFCKKRYWLKRKQRLKGEKTLKSIIEKWKNKGKQRKHLGESMKKLSVKDKSN